jgi:hypothetical protein
MLDFDPRETHHLLFACGEAYETLTGRPLRELSVFLWWFTLEYAQVLKPGPFKDGIDAAKTRRR